MSILVENLGGYLGKSINDVHGRPTGRIVGLSTNIRNEVTAIQIEMGTGDLKTFPVTQLDLGKESPILLPDWKVEAVEIQREYETASRRLTAIDLLLNDGDISKDTYQEMKDNYETALEQIKSRRDKLRETLVDRRYQLEQQIRDLQAALTNNKMLYSSSEIDETSYKAVVSSIREGLARGTSEKADIDETERGLSKIETKPAPYVDTKRGESYAELPEAPISKDLPRIPDVVVVKVREDSAA